jgi:hypothetical protein
MMVVTSWLVAECDSLLSLNIKCSNTKYRETNKQYNNVNKVEISDSVLEIELDIEELCELIPSICSQKWCRSRTRSPEIKAICKT